MKAHQVIYADPNGAVCAGIQVEDMVIDGQYGNICYPEDYIILHDMGAWNPLTVEIAGNLNLSWAQVVFDRILEKTPDILDDPFKTIEEFSKQFSRKIAQEAGY